MTNRKDPYILGLDLDNCCVDYTGAFAQFVEREKGLQPGSLPEPTNYSFVKSGWPFKDTADFLETHGRAVDQGLFRWAEPMPGLREGIDKLHDAGVHIFIVTHRLLRTGTYGDIIGDTARWLDVHGIRYDSFSATVMKQIVSPDIYVDDAPGNVETIRASGTETIVFDQLYNRHLPGPRARNWDELAEMIVRHKETGEI